MVIKRALFIAGVAFALPSATLADDWQDYKGDCEDVFRTAKSAPLQRLKECTGLWTAYVDPAKLKPSDKQSLQDAFTALYNRSTAKEDEEGQYLARSGAERIGVRLAVDSVDKPAEGIGAEEKPRKTVKGEPPEGAGGRRKFVVQKVDGADKAKANKLVDQGVKAFRAKKRGQALKLYEQALEADPSNERALFNAAAEHSFADNKDECNEYLYRLQDIGSAAALKALLATRSDPDFENVRDTSDYKRATGYAKIKLVNSIGEYGEDEVDRISKTLTKLDMKPEEVGDDKTKNRETPVIWFKPHSAATAYVVKQVVVHPGTIMTQIHWETEYDVIVSWGNKLVKKDGVKQPAKDYTDVENPEKKLDALKAEQDKALRQPEAVARKVDYAVDTPERVENKVEGSVKRVENTFDKIEKTGDKLDKIFK